MFVVARLGVMLLTVAAAGAAVMGLLPGSDRRQRPSVASAMAAMVVAVSGGMAALGVLGWAFLREDWRFATVVGYARADVAPTLRLAAIWAGPEGSLLLWTVMLALATVVALTLGASAVPGRLLAATTAAYALVVATVADPFERLAAPPGAGNGLQPVLEHPAMLWHPPILYLGLIGLLVAGALAAGDRQLGARAGITLPAALALLTAGLATGSNWAYVELGWGGYWAWDPIENAGLVAWLAGAAVLHRLTPAPGIEGVEYRRLSPVVAVAASVPAIAAVWATTITRTGVLNSVHAFADRPTLRLLLMTTAVTFTVGTLGLAARPVGPEPDEEQPAADRGSRSPAGFAAIGVATVVVAIGTYEPAVEMLVDDETFVISGRFYSLLLWPVAVAGAALRLRSAGTGANRILMAATAGAVTAMVIVTAAAGWSGLVLAAAGGAVAATAGAETRASGRAIATAAAGLGSRLTHLGVGVLLVGVAGTTATTSATVVALTDAPAVSPVGTVIHRGVEIVDRGSTTEAVATVELADGGTTRRFHPRQVSYVTTGGQSTEVATDRGWLADTQVALVDADADQATYRISRQPRITLVWIGAFLTTIGLATAAITGTNSNTAGRGDR